MAPNDKAPEAAAKEAHDLAKDAKGKQAGESADVALAGEGRVAAMDRVDDMVEDERQVRGEKSSRRKTHPELVGKTFTALQSINRSHKAVYPGDEIKFEDGEGAHVLDLLTAKVIVEGAPSSKEVKEALGLADLARGKALAS